jgi:hypothetical protein
VEDHVGHAALLHRALHLGQRVHVGAARDDEDEHGGDAARDGVTALGDAVRGKRLVGVAEVNVGVEEAR